jgi:hypothetical protein
VPEISGGLLCGWVAGNSASTANFRKFFGVTFSEEFRMQHRMHPAFDERIGDEA